MRRKILIEDDNLAPFSGEWNNQAVSHLLKRVLYGVTKQDLTDFGSLGLSGSITQLVSESPTPQPPINNYSSILDEPDPDVPVGETWVTAPRVDVTEYPKRLSLKGWLFDKMMHGETTIHYKMVHFWHNLLVTSTNSATTKLSYQYFELLRKNALGNFKVLIKDITLNPAMLIYLNGNQNVSSAPDENYGRELQELFCLGKGPNSQYTEGDVQAMARLLTGWYTSWNQYINEGAALTGFRPNRHDPTDKAFSAFYGNRIIEGRDTIEGAEQELDEAIDMIFDVDEVSYHICRKLYQFFLYSEISEEAELTVITPLAQLFRDSEFEIAPVLEALLSSSHFYDEMHRGVLVKSPLEFLFGTWRSLGMQYNDPDNMDEIFHTHRTMIYYLDQLGMNFGDPPNVAGWPAYYQLPLTDRAWITTDTITFRALLTDNLANYGLYINNNGETLWIFPDFIRFVKTLDEPDDTRLMIAEVSEIFLGISLAEEAVSELRSILLSGQEDDFYWWDAWNSHINFPANEMYKTTVENRLRPFFRTLFQLGEFNLM